MLQNALLLVISIISLAPLVATYQKAPMKEPPSYEVTHLTQSLSIDGRWDKPVWQSVPTLRVTHYMGKKPDFRPEVEAKMQYDAANLYLIFRVHDRFVRCITQEINGPVWEDSCVEFFFAPDTDQPTYYFNLEINAGGTPLMHYNIIPREKVTILPADAIRSVEIAHSLPTKVDPERTDSVTWTVEYRIPLNVLRAHAPITPPAPGVVWRANFYKIAENTSNPHYITWAPVDLPKPDFHTPRFFGALRFR